MLALRKACLLLFAVSVLALQYDPAFVDYNFNVNQTATNILDYSAEWPGHTYTASPSNWRFPVYTIILDKWLNGNPSNDDANGTVYEFDFYETGLRNGGDIAGVVDSLDYLSGMGVKVSQPSLSASSNRPLTYLVSVCLRYTVQESTLAS